MLSLARVRPGGSKSTWGAKAHKDLLNLSNFHYLHLGRMNSRNQEKKEEIKETRDGRRGGDFLPFWGTVKNLKEQERVQPVNSH